MKTKIFQTPFIALLIKWSGIAITDGRGKVGGTVLSKSRSGATARNKVTPINRRTSAQTRARAIFTSFSQAWRSLTSSQISAWNAFAAGNLKVTNIFGDVVANSGINLYIALNSVLSLIGVAAISDPPDANDTPTGITGVTPTAGVGATELFLDANFIGNVAVVPADDSVLLYATPPMSPGVSYVRSQLRYLTTLVNATDTSTFNLWATYVAVYGAPAVGDNIVLAAHPANKVSGITGTPVQAKVVISA